MISAGITSRCYNLDCIFRSHSVAVLMLHCWKKSAISNDCSFISMVDLWCASLILVFVFWCIFRVCRRINRNANQLLLAFNFMMTKKTTTTATWKFEVVECFQMCVFVMVRAGEFNAYLMRWRDNECALAQSVYAAYVWFSCLAVPLFHLKKASILMHNKNETSIQYWEWERREVGICNMFQLFIESRMFDTLLSVKNVFTHTHTHTQRCECRVTLRII